MNVCMYVCMFLSLSLSLSLSVSLYMRIYYVCIMYVMYIYVDEVAGGGVFRVV